MAKRIIWSGNTTLPAPTSLSVNDEIIWSSDTGRTLSGRMVGDPVAQKKTVSLKWEYLTETEEKIIKNTLVSGYFPVSFHDDGIDITIEVYRGTLSKKLCKSCCAEQYHQSVFHQRDTAKQHRSIEN